MALDRDRLIGATLGAAGGPAAGFGAWFSGIGDGRAHVWLIATLVGAILGGLTWPVFTLTKTERDTDVRQDPPGIGFAALFGCCCGLLAGCLAAFPMGGVMGCIGGAVGAVASAACWRLQDRLGPLMTSTVAALSGMSAGFIAIFWWSQ